jgi:transcriptional regulator
MHPNSRFAVDDREGLLALAGQIAFGRVFLTLPEGPRVAHAPMLRKGNALRFHLANANALRHQLVGARPLVLFEGPNAYLSANWYGDVRGAVPTWNYVSVECEGPVRELDRAGLVMLLDDLSAVLEPRVGENWTRAKMEPARFEAMLGAITAFELTVDAVRGTRKLSQNQRDDEAARVVAGFEKSGRPDMASAIREARG